MFNIFTSRIAHHVCATRPRCPSTIITVSVTVNPTSCVCTHPRILTVIWRAVARPRRRFTERDPSLLPGPVEVP
jgi:hypothetical protein